MIIIRRLKISDTELYELCELNDVIMCDAFYSFKRFHERRHGNSHGHSHSHSFLLLSIVQCVCVCFSCTTGSPGVSFDFDFPLNCMPSAAPLPRDYP